MLFRRRKETARPEWMIVGLGNPGGQYDGTRHNIGFEVIRELSNRHNLRLGVRKHSSNYGVGAIAGAQVALVRPMTYMNRSGAAVGALLREFNLAPERMVVVFDDMDLDVGRVLVKPQGGPGTHNGMRDIIEALDTEGFPRVRIGIGKPVGSGADYVLRRFEPEELDLIIPAIRLAADACEWIVAEGINAGMNRANRTNKTEDASDGR
ncbi:MAG: aminoacyl-tRNA hydrolase [Armatimonadota bacterium]